uniref:Uncharacterized protein n=1 Tax=Arundo donax TaxID=35708 RepID=A0A0A9HUN4_ARUDO
MEAALGALPKTLNLSSQGPLLLSKSACALSITTRDSINIE